ncbi:MAG: class C sortase [Acutalibacteraceae bacterium]|nr:class C sortase [Acutalibacteraceae bacterium]
MKKGSLLTIILTLLIIVGLSLVLYPTFSNYWNELHQTKAIANYDSVISDMSTEDRSNIFEEAIEYNKALRKIRFPLMYYDQVSGYNDLLNVSKDGVMGYITIDKINVELPIYHGIDETVLQVAVGHIQGSSLPTGGESTHCAFSAHRGLPSARLFTDLDKLEIGDVFKLTILDQTLTYQVDQIRIVDPENIEPLYVVDGEDYCTLVTCTPYGVNSHRMLVRGTRIENEKQLLNIRVTADVVIINPVVVAPFIATPILLVLFIMFMLPKRPKKKNPYLKEKSDTKLQ